MGEKYEVVLLRLADFWHDKIVSAVNSGNKHINLDHHDIKHLDKLWSKLVPRCICGFIIHPSKLQPGFICPNCGSEYLGINCETCAHWDGDVDGKCSRLECEYEKG